MGSIPGGETKVLHSPVPPKEKDIIFSSSHESGSYKSVVPNNKMKAQNFFKINGWSSDN